MKFPLLVLLAAGALSGIYTNLHVILFCVVLFIFQHYFIFQNLHVTFYRVCKKCYLANWKVTEERYQFFIWLTSSFMLCVREITLSLVHIADCFAYSTLFYKVVHFFLPWYFLKSTKRAPLNDILNDTIFLWKGQRIPNLAMIWYSTKRLLSSPFCVSHFRRSVSLSEVSYSYEDSMWIDVLNDILLFSAPFNNYQDFVGVTESKCDSKFQTLFFHIYSLKQAG